MHSRRMSRSGSGKSGRIGKGNGCIRNRSFVICQLSFGWRGPSQSETNDQGQMTKDQFPLRSFAMPFDIIQMVFWLCLAGWFGLVLFAAMATPVIFRTVEEADPTL